jgi:hypothetical protein
MLSLIQILLSCNYPEAKLKMLEKSEDFDFSSSQSDRQGIRITEEVTISNKKPRKQKMIETP